MGEVKPAFSLLTAALLAAGCAHHTADPGSRRYVSLGSSFAAGTSLGGLKTDTPARCGRSSVNYASLLAVELQLELTDAACNGATTTHVLEGWNELPPQIAAITPDTRLVTITIGGNDLGYVMNLAAASCDPAKGLSFGGMARPCPTLKLPTEQDYARTEAALRAIARAVRARAPASRLIFVQYVQLVPPNACAKLGLNGENAQIMRLMGQRLAEITARAARKERAEVLDARRLSAQHTPCDAQPWSAGPVPNGPPANAPWHPNMAGHAAIAKALAQQIRNL